MKYNLEENDTGEQVSHFSLPEKSRRRKLLPWWIKVFIWIFMVFGAIAPFGLILGLFGLQFEFALYGLDTALPISMTGILIAALFFLKGVVSYGLWFEKPWAITVGQVDAIIGIIICVFVMLVQPFIDDYPGFKLNLRLELILLIPYLVKLGNIKNLWINDYIEAKE